MPRTTTANGSVDSRQILAALRAVKKGDFTVRLPVDQAGVNGALAEAFNDVVDLLQNGTQEIARIGSVVGKEGRIKQRAALPGVRVEASDGEAGPGQAEPVPQRGMRGTGGGGDALAA